MAKRRLEGAWPSVLLFGVVLVFFTVTSLMFFVPHCSPLASSEELPDVGSDVEADPTTLELGDAIGDLP